MSTFLSAVTDTDFDRVIECTTVPVLVVFWKVGCGHCQVLMKELTQLQRELGEAVVTLTMNVEENYQIPAELEVSSLPVLALYRDGSFERFIGGLGKKDEIRKQLGL